MLLPRSYPDAVQAAGGIAVLLAPDPLLTAEPDRVLDLLDGLILAGGRDVDPVTYGEDPHPETDESRPERDHFELALAKRAMERDMPFLGICRGMQVMNVARGGTLVQDLPEHLGHQDHRRTLGTFEGNDHPVRLDAGSLAARAAGEEQHGTLSHHHQGVGEIGDGLAVTRLVDRRRAARGARGPRAPLRARRAVASRGRRRVARDRRARRRGPRLRARAPAELAAMHDAAVIGGGVVGCAVALALARRGADTVLLEAEDELARWASGTNSGILHTGFDSTPGRARDAR